jgi:hypothetical protein
MLLSLSGLVQELSALQFMEMGVEQLRADGRHGGQHRVGYVPPYHRGRTEQSGGTSAQAGDTRGEHLLYGARNDNPVESAGQLVGAALALKRSSLVQGTYDLLDEERVSVGPLDEQGA